MHPTSFACPACQARCASDELVCPGCGLIFATYQPTAGPVALPVPITPVAAPLFRYTPLQPGQQLAQGRYTVQRPLSSGGMGAIFLATDHEAFDRTVVIKALLDYF